MTAPPYSVFCDRCGERLDDLPVSLDEYPPCPQCGSTDQKRVFRDGGVLLTGAPIYAPARKWIGEHPGWSAFGLGVSVGGVVVTPFLGPLWGGGIGALVLLISYWAFKKSISEGTWVE